MAGWELRKAARPFCFQSRGVVVSEKEEEVAEWRSHCWMSQQLHLEKERSLVG